jgi:hypothetical protein
MWNCKSSFLAGLILTVVIAVGCRDASKGKTSGAAGGANGSGGTTSAGGDRGTDAGTDASVLDVALGGSGGLEAGRPADGQGGAAGGVGGSIGTDGGVRGSGGLVTTGMDAGRESGGGGDAPIVGRAETGDASTTSAVDCGSFSCSAILPAKTSCASGRCTVSLASGPGIYLVAFDATNVYWAEIGNPSSDGAIKSVPKGGGKTTTIVSKQPSAHGIAVDDNNVYWVNDHAGDDGGEILRAPKTGGPPTTLATVAISPGRLAINDTNVFWTSCGDPGGDVMTVAKAGGTVTTLDTGSCFAGIVVDATRVYYGNYSAYNIWSVATTGGERSLIGPYQNRPGSMAQDDNYVYWVNNAPNGGIAKVAKAGGGPIAIASNQAFPTSVAVDGTNVYWTLRDAHTLMTAPLDGGTVTTLYTYTGSVTLSGLSVDDNVLYWTVTSDSSSGIGSGIAFTPL